MVGHQPKAEALPAAALEYQRPRGTIELMAFRPGWTRRRRYRDPSERAMRRNLVIGAIGAAAAVGAEDVGSLDGGFAIPMG